MSCILRWHWPVGERYTSTTTPDGGRRTMDKDSSSALPSGNDFSSAPAHPRMPLRAIAADVLRHALPLVSLYAFNGSIEGYLLLTAFDLSLGLMLIVGTTRERKDPTMVDPRSRWLVSRVASVLVLAILLAILSAIITLPIAAPALIFGLADGVDWWSMMSHRGFWIPVAGMSILAAIRAQRAFEATTTPGLARPPTRKAPVIGDLERDRKQSLAAKAAQVTLIATFVGLCYVLITFGRWGLYALPIIYAALLVFYDIRPDLAQRLFPKLWQEE